MSIGEIGEITEVGIDWKSVPTNQLEDVLESEITRFRRRTMSEIWSIGLGLIETRDRRFPDGGFLSFLQTLELNSSTAYEMMDIAKYVKSSEIRNFKNKSEALKHVAAVKKSRLPKPEKPAPDAQVRKREADERAMEAEIAGELEIIDAEITEDRDMQSAIRDVETDEADKQDDIARLTHALERTEEMRRKAVQRAETAERKLKRICDDLCRVRGIDDAVGKVDDILANHFRTGRKVR